MRIYPTHSLNCCQPKVTNKTTSRIFFFQSFIEISQGQRLPFVDLVLGENKKSVKQLGSWRDADLLGVSSGSKLFVLDTIVGGGGLRVKGLVNQVCLYKELYIMATAAKAQSSILVEPSTLDRSMFITLYMYIHASSAVCH